MRTTRHQLWYPKRVFHIPLLELILLNVGSKVHVTCNEGQYRDNIKVEAPTVFSPFSRLDAFIGS
jgi:hypothetical protein